MDTGAAVSVIPHSVSPSTAQGPTLAGADGKGITSWGKVLRSVCFNGKTFTDVPFVLAAVSKPILGANFFTEHHLLVDTATNRVNTQKPYSQSAALKNPDREKFPDPKQNPD